eukprot:scaffold1311_cov121-Isochrysis_galbana.AAC.7
MLYSPARQSHPECTVSCSALSAARDLALTTEVAKHKPAVPAKTSALAAHTAATRRHSVSWTSSSAIAMKSRAGMDSRPTKAERPAASADDRMASRRHRRPSRIMLTHWHSAVASGSSICPTLMRLVPRGRAARPAVGYCRRPRPAQAEASPAGCAAPGPERPARTDPRKGRHSRYQ